MVGRRRATSKRAARSRSACSRATRLVVAAIPWRPRTHSRDSSSRVGASVNGGATGSRYVLRPRSCDHYWCRCGAVSCTSAYIVSGVPATPTVSLEECEQPVGEQRVNEADRCFRRDEAGHVRKGSAPCDFRAASIPWVSGKPLATVCIQSGSDRAARWPRRRAVGRA